MDEDNDDIMIEGFANTTDMDRGGDVILESAWTKGGLDNYLKNPILLAFHDMKKPIGTMTNYGVNNKGLQITGRITKAAGEVYDLVKDGVLQAFSVGFRVKDAEYDIDTDIFVIKDLELHEISVVSVPMNQNSLFSIKKSFEDDTEYNEFKDSFIVDTIKSTDTKGDTNVPKNENTEGLISLTAEELAAQTEKAIADAFAKAKAIADADEKAKAIAIEAGKTGAEELMAKFEKRLDDDKAEMAKAMEGLQADLKEKSSELEALTKSKMRFAPGDNDRGKLTNLEIDTAVLVAKMVNKRVDETDYFKNNLQAKAVGDGDHLGGTEAAAYETEFSTRMYDAVQDKLVLEPLFAGTKIQMNSRSMVFPFNPQAGYASWVTDANYKSFVNPSQETTVADGTGPGANASSTSVARNHAVTDIRITAEKLASKEAIGYEEEEDAIIPIVPIVTNAISKRMARTTDTELLRGNIGTATVADIGSSLINGVATQADDNNAEFTQAGAFGATNPITVADLQATRRTMSSWGLNPNDVVYVVSESAMYDLLDDPDFRTMDLVGQNATILTGQIGSVNGSPVVVSDSFAAPAIDAYAAVALNVNNYLFGELRGLTTERDRDVLNQKNWIVTTRRFAFESIDATEPSCAVLKYPAA